MKFFRSLPLVLALCLVLSAVTASAEEILTNRSVERMVAAGLSPDIITSKITTTRTNFDVSIDSILQLKKEGIHDDIIKAMVESAGSQNIAPPQDNRDQSGQYYEPSRSYEPNSSYSGAYLPPQQKMDPNAKLLQDIEEAAALKEKRDYTWKTKAHAIGATLKTIYPSNTHNIKYWWAYTQYSLLVEKESHQLKGIKKVLYFDAHHEDALILKGDILFAQAKRLPPGDGSAGYSREDMADEATKTYKTALDLPNLPAAKKSKIYYHLGELAKEIGMSTKRAEDYWQKAMDEDPQGQWAVLAAGKLGVMPPQSNQGQYEPSAN
ncbi:MAG: hypothetical protein KKD73_10350 [Proteobacteria bacterium]|nr:hypothetical protein [Pseudomonadota bacterium]MBU1640814.1 hypothetical protein [Pseudomonadota bacterium]